MDDLWSSLQHATWCVSHQQNQWLMKPFIKGKKFNLAQPYLLSYSLFKVRLLDFYSASLFCVKGRLEMVWVSVVAHICSSGSRQFNP